MSMFARGDIIIFYVTTFIYLLGFFILFYGNMGSVEFAEHIIIRRKTNEGLSYRDIHDW